MKKAVLFRVLNNKIVECEACYHHCRIPLNKRGICGIRKNINGQLFLMVYGRPVAVNIDPIEKKPLFHFLPGSEIFSLGTWGCNFGCLFCQNYDISQVSKADDFDLFEEPLEEWPPEKVAKFCLDHRILSIAYTYNEPTVWIEYAYDIMKLAHKKGIKNVWVSNGYFSEQTLKLVAPYLDAINIDLKSFSDDFYRKICQARLAPIEENIKKLWQKNIWVEVTTLVIPQLNDSEKELTQIAKFLYQISPNLPWHISAFYPAYKMIHHPSTPKETLLKAYKIGKKVGLKYVYTGNIPDHHYESTYCPSCGELLIKREGLMVLENKLKQNQCPFCHQIISGRFI